MNDEDWEQLNSACPTCGDPLIDCPCGKEVVLEEGYIYLASPYSHDDPAIKEQRFDVVCRLTGALMNLGMLIYSPIAHSHSVNTRCGFNGTWEFYERSDRAMIGGSRKLIVACIDGWRESKGVKAEIEIARDLGMPLEYLVVAEDGSMRLSITEPCS